MKVILFGATGMVGQSVLRECLIDPDVGEVSIVRTACSASPEVPHAAIRRCVAFTSQDPTGPGDRRDDGPLAT